jgi:UDP-glucose 4-epimerase
LAHLPLANISAQYTEEATTSIINGTVNILNIMKDRDFVKKIIYASSSMTYGDFKEIPAPENHPQEPKDVYGGMKLAGEKIIQAYSRRFGVNYVIIRPSAVYGFTDVNERVSGIFIKNAFEGKELILNNRGDTKLDFTYVEDTAKGFVLACDPEIKNEIFNITRGEGRSLKEFAEIVKKIIPSTKIKINGEEDSFRPKRGAMDISKARNILGYEPKYSLEEGIKKTINLIKENENSIM